MAKDPVCGMDVEEKNAKWTTDHNGQKYYFCSLHDKREFDGDPEKYASKEPIEPRKL